MIVPRLLERLKRNSKKDSSPAKQSSFGAVRGMLCQASHPNHIVIAAAAAATLLLPDEAAPVALDELAHAALDAPYKPRRVPRVDNHARFLSPLAQA